MEESMSKMEKLAQRLEQKEPDKSIINVKETESKIETLDPEKINDNLPTINAKVDPVELCASIVASIVDNLSLKKRKSGEELLLKNGQITISKVQTTEKKTPTFRCMMCNAKIRFPPSEGDDGISPRYNRAAKAKYRSHLSAEHNANSRYPGMELLVRTTFEQQFPVSFGDRTPFGSNGLIGNNGFVIPEKYRLSAFVPSHRLLQRPKAFEPKVIMQEEDMEEEENDDEIKTLKVDNSKKTGVQITVLDDESSEKVAKEKDNAKKKQLSEESKEVPITVESGDDSDGTEDESEEDSESDSSVASVEEEDDEGEEEDDEFKEFKSMEMDSPNIGDKRPLPLPASIREDLNMKYRKISPTINKLTGLPFGWKKEVIRRAIGSSGFDIYIRNPVGKVFRTKSDLRSYCALYPNKTMGINPDAVFTSGVNLKPVEVDLDKDEGDVECIDL